MPRITTTPKQKSLPLPSPSSVVQYKPPTIGQSIKEGFGVGIGVSLANRLVSNIFGPPTIQTSSPTVNPPYSAPTPFEQCIAEHREDITVCAHLANSGQSNIKK